MKKTLILAALIMSPPSLATKARMQALGQDSDRGSFLFKDARNIFYNPVHVLELPGRIIAEWGAGESRSDGPHPEGGIFQEKGRSVYGLYLGRTQKDSWHQHLDQVIATKSSPGSESKQTLFFLPQDRRVDLFFAMGLETRWGVHFYWAFSEDEGGEGFKDEQGQPLPSNKGFKPKQFTADYNAMGLNLGVIRGELELYGNVEFSHKGKGEVGRQAVTGDEVSYSDSEYEGDLGLAVGLKRKLAGLTFHLEWAQESFELSEQSTGQDEEPGQGDFSQSTTTLGVGQIIADSEKSSWFWHGRWITGNSQLQSTVGERIEVTSDQLVLTFGFEARINSWLSWRGSVSQDVFLGSRETIRRGGESRDGTFSNSNHHANQAAMGASFHFSSITIDSVLAKKIDSDELFSNVSMSYDF